MRSHNDMACIRQTLEALLSQELDEQLEIISCDDHSQDGTAEYLQSIPQIRRIAPPEGRYVPGKTLNCMISQAKGDYIVFNNADAIPQRISKPYKSFFGSECKESFRIKTDDREFECTLISTVDRLVPLVFTSPTDAQFTRRLGTKRRHIDINHPISFFPAGEGEQILIINPSVKFVFVTDGVEMREIEMAQRLWNFTLYRDFEFIGALERGHIGKV